jgi:hypothetical protein
MLDCKRKPIGLTTNPTDTVKNFHHLHIKELLRIELAKRREIGWGRNMTLIANPNSEA